MVLLADLLSAEVGTAVSLITLRNLITTQSVIEEPAGPIEEVAVGTAPERTLRRRKNQPKGTFRRMQERGITITNYSERGWRKEKEESN